MFSIHGIHTTWCNILAAGKAIANMVVTYQRRRQLEDLLTRLGISQEKYGLVHWQLLDQALTHPSVSPTYNNDHLELLGDSVLRLAVSLLLHQRYGDRKVGDLSALRAYLVSDECLAQLAESINLDEYIQVDAHVRRDQKTKRSRIANAVEALLAALYLSTQDFSLIDPWLFDYMERAIATVQTIPALGNYKLALQELTQRVWKQLPEYHIVGQTPFTAEVWFLQRCWGRGSGNSIKSAEQNAAAEALPLLQAYLKQQSQQNQ
jgi:ribonuclease-3